jgi:hypothetical protein
MTSLCLTSSCGIENQGISHSWSISHVAQHISYYLKYIPPSLIEDIKSHVHEKQTKKTLNISRKNGEHCELDAPMPDILCEKFCFCVRILLIYNIQQLLHMYSNLSFITTIQIFVKQRRDMINSEKFIFIKYYGNTKI